MTVDDPTLHLIQGHNEKSLASAREALDSLPPILNHEVKSLDEILGQERDHAERLYRDNANDPDFDLLPIFHFEGPGGVLPLVAPFGDDTEQDFVFQRLAPEIMAGVRAEVWALGHPIYKAPYGEGVAPGPSEEGYVMPRDRPDRIEAVNVHGCDLDRYVSWHAVVDRTERGVRLGPWEKVADRHWQDVGGRVVEPLNEELIRVRLSRAAREMTFDAFQTRETNSDYWTPERVAAFETISERIGEGPQSARDAAKLPDSHDLFVVLGIFEEFTNAKGEKATRPSLAVMQQGGLGDLYKDMVARSER